MIVRRHNCDTTKTVSDGDTSKDNSAFRPSGVGKWVPASAGKAKAGMVHSVSGCTPGVQVKLWDPLRTRAIPERLRGVITTRRYTNPRLPLPLPPPHFCWTEYINPAVKGSVPVIRRTAGEEHWETGNDNITRDIWNYTCIIFIFVFRCTHVRMSYVLNSYLLTYLLT